MRNLTDEQVQEIAFTVVGDHLAAGIEYIDITEGVDDFSEEEEPTDMDYTSVASYVNQILGKLQLALIDLQ